MKILVIPDVHLKPQMFLRAAALLDEGAASQAVCLMDLADDWNQEFNVSLYEETYDAAIDFARRYPETRWCYGNHDLCYQWNRRESGYSAMAAYTVQKKLMDLRETVSAAGTGSQICYIQRIDNVLFSHGGLYDGFVRHHVTEELYDALDSACCNADDTFNGVNSARDDADDAFNGVNSARNNADDAFNGVNSARNDADDAFNGVNSARNDAGFVAVGADSYYEKLDKVLAVINKLGPHDMWLDASPIWLRPQTGGVLMYQSERLLQVVGHTPMPEITRKGNVLSCDVFSTYRDGTPSGSEEFCIVDTKTWEWKGVK